MSQYMTDYVENLEKLNEAKIQRISELERENAALREDKERLVGVIEQMERIHSDIMDRGPNCTCGAGDEWCVQCARSWKLSRLATHAIDQAQKEAQP